MVINNLRRYLDEENFRKLKECDDYVFKSAVLVRILFKNRIDKEGKPYINHLYRVASSMSTPEGQALGFLHDTVEDIRYITFDDLRDFGIPEVVIEALMLVTKKPSEDNISKDEKLRLYNEEIDNIINSGNALAIELKYSDMSDNYSKERLGLLSPEKQEWFKAKYEHNLIKLERKRKEIKND